MASNRGWLPPTDWGGETYVQFTACVPYSPEWMSIFKGSVYEITRAYNWEGSGPSETNPPAQIGMEVYESMATCVGLVEAVEGIRVAVMLNSCCGPQGQGEDNENGIKGGSIPSPVGDIVFQEPSLINDRDCKAANLVHAALKDTFVRLDDYNVDDMGVLGLGLVISIVAGVLASTVATPLAGIIVAVAGSAATFAARLVGVTVSLGNVASVMAAEEEALVCALYSATTVNDARAEYLDVLQANGVTTIEAQLVRLLMYNVLLNTLFFDTPELALFWPLYVGPVDCVVCGGPGYEHVFDFEVGDEQGWSNQAENGRPFGVFVPGAGWESVYGSVGGTFDERLYLDRSFVGSQVTRIDVYYQLDGVAGIGEESSAGTWLVSVLQELGIDQLDGLWPGLHTQSVVFDGRTVDELRTTCVGGEAASGAASALITKIVVFGNGADPF